jgi:hypothetical protein
MKYATWETEGGVLGCNGERIRLDLDGSVSVFIKRRPASALDGALGRCEVGGTVPFVAKI